MKLCEYVEKAEKKAGKQIELAKILGISDAYIRNAKRERSGLPTAICMLLADYIEEDQIKVIAASELVTEKDEKKRKILESCFRKVASAAGITLVTSILTLAPKGTVNAQNLTPELAEIQIIRNCYRRNYRRKSDLLSLLIDKFLSVFPRVRSVA
jgi:hypothetical protein